MRLLRLLAGPVFVAAGTLHFTHTRVYERIMPPYVPAHRGMVLASGAAEIAGGLALLHPRTRPAGGWWLTATLLAVFPANVHMALHAEQFPGIPGRGRSREVAGVRDAGRRRRRRGRRARRADHHRHDEPVHDGFQAQAAGRAGPDRVVMFLCGDDAEAKRVVGGLVEDSGFTPFDLGGLADAAPMEAPRRPGSVYGEELHLDDARDYVARLR